MSRDPGRIDPLLTDLAEFWKKNPDWRLGQVIENAARMGGGKAGEVFYTEDDVIERGLEVLEERSAEGRG